MGHEQKSPKTFDSYLGLHIKVLCQDSTVADEEWTSK